MSDIVYIPTPVEEKPESNAMYAVFNEDAHPSRKMYRGAIFDRGQWWNHPAHTHWLKPVPLSELMAEKDKGIDELMTALAVKYGVAVDFSERSYNGDKEAPMDRYGFIEYLEAELSSLKSRVLEIAKESLEKGGIYYDMCHGCMGDETFDSVAHEEKKSTYINNLKKELNIQDEKG